MKLSMRLAAACSALAMSGPSAAQSPEQAPISSWVLERSPAQCVISRRYGPADAAMTLGFKAPPIGDAVQIVIVRTDYRARVEQRNAAVTIGDKVNRTTALTYPLDERRRRAAHLINLTGEESANLRRAGEIRIKVEGGMDRPFALGPMAGAWSQLDQCLERLRDTWNIGNGRLASSARPIIPLSRLFSESDYPITAILNEQSGTTGIILLIDESGAVKDCTLGLASGIALLDSRTCGTIFARAKFAPATFGDGKPAKSAYRQVITWQVLR